MVSAERSLSAEQEISGGLDKRQENDVAIEVVRCAITAAGAEKGDQ